MIFLMTHILRNQKSTFADTNYSLAYFSDFASLFIITRLSTTATFKMLKKILFFVLLAIGTILQTAKAGPVLVLTASGNMVRTAPIANPDPNIPLTPEERVKFDWTHTAKIDLDTCVGVDYVYSFCSIASSFEISYGSISTPWSRPYMQDGLYGAVQSNFKIDEYGIWLDDNGGFQLSPPPEDFEFPQFWYYYYTSTISASWNLQFDKLSDLDGKNLQIGKDFHDTNASFTWCTPESYWGDCPIMETGFEKLTIKYVSEPNSVALLSLTMAALVTARRRSKKN